MEGVEEGPCGWTAGRFHLGDATLRQALARSGQAWPERKYPTRKYPTRKYPNSSSPKASEQEARRHERGPQVQSSPTPPGERRGGATRGSGSSPFIPTLAGFYQNLLARFISPF